MAKAESEYKLLQRRMHRTGKPDYSEGHKRCYNAPIFLLKPTQEVSKKPPIKILDVGSGIGYGYEQMCKYLRIESYQGIEIDTDSAYHHKTLLQDSKHKVLNDNFLEISTPHDEYDAVFCIEVIEHVELHELEKFVLKLCRSVKPGGFLFISTPDGDSKSPDYNPHGEWSEGLVKGTVLLSGIENIVVCREHWTKLYICQKAL